MTNEQLEAEEVRLNALNSGFASQNLGTKAFAIATRDVIDQLNAVAYVLTQRGTTVITPSRLNVNQGTTDFSGVNDGGCSNRDQIYGHLG